DRCQGLFSRHAARIGAGPFVDCPRLFSCQAINPFGRCSLYVLGARPFDVKQERRPMPGNSRDLIMTAERRFAVRVKIEVPPCGFGQRLPQINAWLDENCGTDGWVMTPSGMRGVLSEAVSIYFADVTLASAFVAHWCVGSKVETTGGLFQVREDEPA